MTVGSESAGNLESLPQNDSHPSTVNTQDSTTILMVGRDASLLSYKAAVLATAHFAVQSASPSQARTILENDPNYELVIFSHTLERGEILDMEKILRARKPATKLLLMLGPGPETLPLHKFDAALRGLDGPAALIRTVQALMAKSA